MKNYNIYIDGKHEGDVMATSEEEARKSASIILHAHIVRINAVEECVYCKQMELNDRYKLTELGPVAKFQQSCGCNAEGPNKNCKEGRKLYKAYSRDNKRWWNNEITLEQADITLTKWQEHLGA